MGLILIPLFLVTLNLAGLFGNNNNNNGGGGGGGRIPAYLAAPAEAQYHIQDGSGKYSYGYYNSLPSRPGIKSGDGIMQGGYSYMDPEGKLQHFQYFSDDINGFQSLGTNFPQAAILVPAEFGPLPILQNAQEILTKDSEATQAVRNQNKASPDVSENSGIKPEVLSQESIFLNPHLINPYSYGPLSDSFRKTNIHISAPTTSNYPYPYYAPFTSSKAPVPLVADTNKVVKSKTEK